MKKYITICLLLSTTLFACQNGSTTNQPAHTPPPAAAPTESEHSKREKDLLEKEKELLRKEIALAKQENAAREAANPTETKTVKKSESKTKEAELSSIDITENVAKSIIYCENKKYFIRVDKLTNGKIRYASWNKPNTTKHVADLMLFDPTIDELEEFGPRYLFYNKGWSYIIEHGEKTDFVEESVYIRLWKDDKEHYYSKMNIL